MLLLGLIIYVAVEITAFVVVAQQIGVLLAVVLVLAISALGPLLIRRAGLGVLAHARERLDQGESPNRDLLDGVVILLAGALICIPGFVGDAIGLVLLIGPVRHVLIRGLGKAMARHLSHRVVMRVGQRGAAPGPIIEASSHAEPPGPRGRRRRKLPDADHPGEGGSPE